MFQCGCTSVHTIFHSSLHQHLQLKWRQKILGWRVAWLQCQPLNHGTQPSNLLTVYLSGGTSALAVKCRTVMSVPCTIDVKLLSSHLLGMYGSLSASLSVASKHRGSGTPVAACASA